MTHLEGESSETFPDPGQYSTPDPQDSVKMMKDEEEVRYIMDVCVRVVC